MKNFTQSTFYKLFTIAISALFFAIAVYSIQESFHLLSHGNLVKAKVIDVQKAAKGKITTIAFKSNVGEQVQCSIRTSLYDLDDELDILYDFNNPNRVKINTTTQLWGYPIAFGFGSLALAYFGISRKKVF